MMVSAERQPGTASGPSVERPAARPTVRVRDDADVSAQARETRERRRTLILLAKRPPLDLRRRIAAGEEPRAEYLVLAERLGAELLDFHDVERSTHPFVRLAPAARSQR